MRRIVIPAVILFTALILSGGFFLPSYVLGFKDQQTIGKLDVTDGMSINFETKSKLGILDRLSMMTHVGSIPLDNGKNMDSDTAYQCALAELGKFNGKSVMDIDLASCKMDRYGVAFFIDSSDPSKNMIVWNFNIDDPGHSVTVYIDDETGKLLALHYAIAVAPDIYKKEAIIRAEFVAPVVDSTLLADSIGEYYGLTAVQSNPDKYDKYVQMVLLLSDGQNSIKLVTEVLTYGFWINI